MNRLLRLRSAAQFVLKASLMLASFYVVTAAGEWLFDRTVNWQAWQNPRTRLLWDGVDPKDDIFIIGDSAFVSGYVDGKDETLWADLQAATGHRVFNGALDGAEPADFLNAGRLLAQYPGNGKVVLLDIIPTRFVRTRIPEQQFGNYPTEFSRRVRAGFAGDLLVPAMKPLRILDVNILVNLIKREQFFGTNEYRDVVWFNDRRALRKFETFEKYWVENGGLEDFGWIHQLSNILEAQGYRLVLVLTPINTALIEAYAHLHTPASYEQRIQTAHARLLAYLNQHHLCYVDAYEHFPSHEFADLVHVNASGDAHMAALIADQLRKCGLSPAQSSVQRAAN